jgi:hypothetical protein
LVEFELFTRANFSARSLWAGRQKKGGREKLVRVTRAEEIVIYSAKVN